MSDIKQILSKDLAQRTGLAREHCKAFLEAMIGLQPQARASYFAIWDEFSGLQLTFPHKEGVQTVAFVQNRLEQASVRVGEEDVLIISESMTASHQAPPDTTVVTLGELPAALERAIRQLPAQPVSAPERPGRRFLGRPR